MEKENTRVYELGYLFVSSLSDEQSITKADALKDMIVSKGGEVITLENPKFIELAYDMAKYIANKKTRFTHGYFGWIKFTLDADALSEIKKELDLDIDVLRFLTIKTVSENTMAPKKFSAKTDRKRRDSGSSVQTDSSNEVSEVVETKEELSEEINTEEVDQKIDEMVSEE